MNLSTAGVIMPYYIDPLKNLDGSLPDVFRFSAASTSASDGDCEGIGDDCAVSLSGAGGTVAVGEEVEIPISAAPQPPSAGACCQLNPATFSFSVSGVEFRSTPEEEWGSGSASLQVVQADSQAASAVLVGSFAKAGYYRVQAQVTATWSGTDASADCSDCPSCGSCVATSSTNLEITAVGIDKIVKSGSLYEGPSYEFTGKNHSLEVIPVPAGESFPDGKLINRIVDKPEGSQLSNNLGSGTSIYIQPDVAGTYIVLSSCGSSSDAYIIHAHELTVQKGQVDVYVGQQVSLSAGINPQPPQSTTYFWTIPTSVAVKGYSLNESGTSAEKFKSDEYWNKNISFYFVDSPGDTTVKVRARITYGSYNEFISSQDEEVACNVFKPTATLTSKTTTEDPPIGVGNDNFLRFGAIERSAGISIDGKVTSIPDNGLNEKIGLVQLINLDQSGVIVPSGFSSWNTGGKYVLDNGNNNGVFYEGERSVLENTGVGNVWLYDSPGTSVFYHTSFQRSDSFKTYLMYKPDDSGIWVPLMKLEWDWQGSAERSTVFSEWEVTGSSHSENPSGGATTEFPEWDQSWNDLN